MRAAGAGRARRAPRSRRCSPPRSAVRSTARSVHALWELTRGNALFLRELVRHGVDQGRLAGTAACGAGAAGRGRHAAGRPRGRADRATPARAGARCSSWSRSPLRSSSGCSSPASRAALEALERERARPAPHGRAAARSPTSPIRCTARRCARGCRPRAPTRSAGGSPTRWRRAACGGGGDLLRIAVWRLEAGAGGDAALFERAAAHALAAPDAALAERLARAAVQAGGGLRRPPRARAGARRRGARSRGAGAVRRPGRARPADDGRARGGRDGGGAQPVLGAWTGRTRRTPCCRTRSGA